MELNRLVPDLLFDGGDLDCGSGLVLLIRENMLKVPDGGIMEMRSREPSVGLDLPPWCRMVGHEYLGQLPGEGHARYFMRKHESAAESQALAEDKQRAQDYEWRVRVRSSGPLESTVYCRNFSFKVGQPASFEERDRHPAALELFLGALGGAIAGAYATDCARAGLEVDDIEVTVRGKLDNVLAHLGLEAGDPSVSTLMVKCFASSFDNEARLGEVFEETLSRSPLVATLAKAVKIEAKLVIG